MQKIISFSIVFFLLQLLLTAQNQAIYELEGRKARQFEKALNYQKKGEKAKAARIYKQLIKKEPGYIRSYLQLAGVYYSEKNYSEAASMLEKAIQIDSSFDAEMYFSLALIDSHLGKRADAVQSYRKYLRFATIPEKKKNRAQKEIARLEFVISAMNNPVPFEPVNPGQAINTSNHEYMASVNVSGDVMVFSRRVRQQEDLYISQKIDGKWGEAHAINELNTAANEAAHCLSQDGNTILFTICDNKEGYGSCDLYQSKKVNGIWTSAENMGKNINSRYWDSQPALSADGQELYFSSSRPGGVGGRDIWRSLRQAEGKWSKAINLGKEINSSKNEEAPFLHPDGKNLYFMSNGFPGMGGFDLYLSRFSDSLWSDPKNLGFPINTEKDEGAIRVAADGMTAYFSSDREDLDSDLSNDLDIYSFKLYGDNRSEAVTYVHGKVLAKESGKALSVDIKLFNNSNAKEILEIRSDHLGEFLIALPYGVNYNLLIEEEEFVYHSENFDLGIPNEANIPIELLIELIALKDFPDTDHPDDPATVILKNVFFKSGSSELDIHNSKIELQKLVDFLTYNQEIRIRIEGHTDSVGSDKDNMELSKNRAKAVYEQLVGKGIQADRLEFLGYGESQPIETNDKESGRKINRRTTFTIITN